MPQARGLSTLLSGGIGHAALWAADSPVVSLVRPSPNHGERRGRSAPNCIVLHYTGMVDGPSALARLCEPASEVSCHYVVAEDGAVIQLVPEMLRAHHAGRSFWAGETDLNSASVGIEIVNGGHDFGLPPFPPAQVAAVIALCRDVAGRHAIVPSRILAHSDIAPSRKQDPGERFPWRTLADAGVGLWVPPPEGFEKALVPGTSGDAVAGLQAALARIGYGIEPSRAYDEATTTVVRAFQRRFRPARVDGIADQATIETLRRCADAFSASRAPAPKLA